MAPPRKPHRPLRVLVAAYEAHTGDPVRMHCCGAIATALSRPALAELVDHHFVPRRYELELPGGSGSSKGDRE
jgi:hypothetical protein